MVLLAPQSCVLLLDGVCFIRTLFQVEFLEEDPVHWWALLLIAFKPVIITLLFPL